MNTAASDTMMQPFVKLAQSNTELLSRYATSPEVTAQAVQVAEGVMRQMQDAALKLSTSNAFGNLTQGLMNNYMDFCTELSQSLAGSFRQGQSSLMQQAATVTSEAIDATQANVRRVRQAS
jgi:tRNA 2-selenouridine synthase SelU